MVKWQNGCFVYFHMWRLMSDVGKQREQSCKFYQDESLKRQIINAVSFWTWTKFHDIVSFIKCDHQHLRLSQKQNSRSRKINIYLSDANFFHPAWFIFRSGNARKQLMKKLPYHYCVIKSPNVARSNFTVYQWIRLFVWEWKTEKMQFLMWRAHWTSRRWSFVMWKWRK